MECVGMWKLGIESAEVNSYRKMFGDIVTSPNRAPEFQDVGFYSALIPMNFINWRHNPRQNPELRAGLARTGPGAGRVHPIIDSKESSTPSPTTPKAIRTLVQSQSSQRERY